jgi:hypothetical protein
MPDNRRARSKLLVFVLALPVFVLVYATAFGGRIWAALRPGVAALLGATVIGSVYAGEAARRAPATPMRAAAVFALAVMLVVPAVAPSPASAAKDPAEAVIAAASEYVGSGYRLGMTGPRKFDCSGLMYRIFSDAGELPRIGGMRLRARGYMRWFVARGLFTREESEARRGDLVVYNSGSHIGIYLGEGKVLSALREPWGVSVHKLHGVRLPVSYFLQVDWSRGNGSGGDDGGDKPGDGDKPEKPSDGKPPEKPTDDDTDKNTDANTGKKNKDKNNGVTATGTRDRERPTTEGNNARPKGLNGFATGTMNLRVAADPDARIIGWVGRGAYFKIIGTGTSPAGYNWYEVQTRGGKEGWVYSRWVQELR